MLRRTVLAVTISVAIGATSWVAFADAPPLDGPAAANVPAERVGGAPAPVSAPAPDPLVALAADVADRVNGERTSRGLAPVAWDVALASAARRHSNDMAANQFLSHTGSDGSSFDERIRDAGYSGSPWGEAAAAGYTTSESVVEGWMNSAGHRAILLSPDAADVGVAVARSSSGTYYWTLNTGRR